MKNSKLIIGVGIGLLVGGAIAAYLITSDEEKQEFVDEINSTVKRAKKTIGRVVEDGLAELDSKANKVSKTAMEAVNNIKKGMS
ncbi:gas vesicle protein [Dysgonomonadaceae bacterium PH5-43]|nr:gas vesicle protein [Dysgonomonadaceae bacterium PH5-43]